MQGLNRESAAIVTAVIPTRHRPDMVVRAAQSVLNQTVQEIEIVVVLDGPDPVSVAALRSIGSPRLRIIELSHSVGGAEARNIGIKAADTPWVALLDDDDEWMPTKIQKQLAEAQKNRERYSLISCRVVARTPNADYVWPRRFPGPCEPISEYLIARKSPFEGEGVVQTSTFFATRQLFEQFPFKRDQRKYQDTEWLLRVGRLPGFKLRLLDEPLSVYHIEESRKTISSTSNWRYSYEWASSNKELFTKRAYSAFMLHRVAAEAADERAWNAIKILAVEALRNGKPRVGDFGIFSSMWLIPRPRRRRLRDLVISRGWAGRSS